MPRIPRRLLALATLVATAMLLAACGTGAGNGGGNGNGDDDGNDDTPTAGAHRIGNVQVVEEEPFDPSAGDPTVSASASFVSLDAELPAGFVSDPYAYNADTCTVTTVDEDFEVPFPDDVDVDFTALDAGEAITLRSGGGVYATLEVPEGEGFTATGIYTTEAELAGPIPDDLTVTVPGTADFPAFEDAELPDVEPVALTAPADTTAIGAETTFSWTAQAGDDASYLRLGLMGGTFTDATYVDCIVADDGEFTLPAETTAELDAGFSGTLTDLARLAVRSETEGDATLVLVSEWTALLPVF